MVTRDDDTEDKVTHRYHVYQKETQPLLTFYDNYLKRIDCLRSIEEINRELVQLVERFRFLFNMANEVKLKSMRHAGKILAQTFEHISSIINEGSNALQIDKLHRNLLSPMVHFLDFWDIKVTNTQLVFLRMKKLFMAYPIKISSFLMVILCPLILALNTMGIMPMLREPF